MLKMQQNVLFSIMFLRSDFFLKKNSEVIVDLTSHEEVGVDIVRSRINLIHKTKFIATNAGIGWSIVIERHAILASYFTSYQYKASLIVTFFFVLSSNNLKYEDLMVVCIIDLKKGEGGIFIA